MPSLADRLSISPHPGAPLFSGSREDSRLAIAHAIGELDSQNPQTTGEIRELIRQLGLVSLFFFLKYIQGPFGPYDLIDEDLGLDMCNFRQSPDVMGPGSKAAAFIPRGMYKTTIFTHGADTWELTRNPNLRIGLINAIADRAQQFMHQIQRNIDSNPLYGELYPRHVPKKGRERWNAVEMVMPNRTKFYKEPSVKPLGAAGSAEGDHFDLQNHDDLVGMDDLTGDRGASTSMRRTTQWFIVSLNALRVDVKSRAFLAATRYAIDDPYQIPMDDCRKFIGYRNPNFVEKDDGAWVVYYRMAIEDGKPILPSIQSKGDLEKLAQDDYWTYVTQYLNDPQQTGLAEFYDMEPKKAQLFSRDGEHYIRIEGDNYGSEEVIYPLQPEYVDVVMSLDPAFTDKGMSAKTSRTSLALWAMTPEGVAVRFWQRVGYFSAQQTIDYIIDGHRQFGGAIRKLCLETNGAQKQLPEWIRRAGAEADVYVNIDGKPETGDKTARIRQTVGLFLSKGRVALCDGAAREFIEEMKVFPMSEFRKDVLDESEKALKALIAPTTQEEVLLDEQEEEDRLWQTDNAAGY